MLLQLPWGELPIRHHPLLGLPAVDLYWSALSIDIVLPMSVLGEHDTLSRGMLGWLSCDSQCSLRLGFAIATGRLRLLLLLMPTVLLDESSSLLIHVHRIEGHDLAIWEGEMLDMVLEGRVTGMQLRGMRLWRSAAVNCSSERPGHTIAARKKSYH